MEGGKRKEDMKERKSKEKAVSAGKRVQGRRKELYI